MAPPPTRARIHLGSSGDSLTVMARIQSDSKKCVAPRELSIGHGWVRRKSPPAAVACQHLPEGACYDDAQAFEQLGCPVAPHAR